MMLEQHIEALIFASEKPVTPKEIKAALQESFQWELTDEEFNKAIDAIRDKFNADTFAFQLTMTGGGYEFMTKKDYAPLINTFLNQKAKKRLTRAALETLSIIAYKQPVSKAEIEQIRGVNCDYAVQKLLEKELIVIAGRADSVGHPLTYATSEQFMDYFGINSPADLPKLREIEAGHDNEIGPAPEIEELASGIEGEVEVIAEEPVAQENQEVVPDEIADAEENVKFEEVVVEENVSEETVVNEEQQEEEEVVAEEPVAQEENPEVAAGTEEVVAENEEVVAETQPELPEEVKEEVQEFRQEQLQKLHKKSKKKKKNQDVVEGSSESETEEVRHTEE